jgi:hypothetical protein
MKKSVNTYYYSIFSQESKINFFAFSSRFFRQKNEITTMCSPIIFLFQEKLPIIYANIRV